MSAELPYITQKMYSGYTIQTDVNAVQKIVKYRWIGIPDLRKPNTKRPTYIKRKFVTYKYPIYVFEPDRTIIMHPSILAEIEKRMQSSMQRRMEEQITSVFGVKPATFSQKPAIFDQEAYKKMLSLIPLGPDPYGMLTRGFFERPAVESDLSDNVDAIRYNWRMGHDFGFPLKTNDNPGPYNPSES
jgi:hypothetical protein